MEKQYRVISIPKNPNVHYKTKTSRFADLKRETIRVRKFTQVYNLKHSNNYIIIIKNVDEKKKDLPTSNL